MDPDLHGAVGVRKDVCDDASDIVPVQAAERPAQYLALVVFGLDCRAPVVNLLGTEILASGKTVVPIADSEMRRVALSRGDIDQSVKLVPFLMFQDIADGCDDSFVIGLAGYVQERVFTAVCAGKFLIKCENGESSPGLAESGAEAVVTRFRNNI
jgi:hypothetical protein